MARIGSAESVPDEFSGVVLETSWGLHDKPLVNVERLHDVGWDLPLHSILRIPPTVSDDTPLKRVPAYFEHDDCPAVVVVDDLRRPLGVITPKCLFEAIHRRGMRELRAATALSAVCSGGSFCRDDMTVGRAAQHLIAERQEYAVVVRADGLLAGVVLALDLLSAVYSRKEGQRG